MAKDKGVNKKALNREVIRCQHKDQNCYSITLCSSYLQLYLQMLYEKECFF